MTDEILPRPSRRRSSRQVAALCYRRHRGTTQILLITSRDSKRWIVPKGWPMQGKTPAEAARQEAWEEAGVRGSVANTPLGEFTYAKGLDDGSDVLCKTAVYPVRVDRLEDSYPEDSERERTWADPDDAAEMVEEPELRRLIKRL